MRISVLAVMLAGPLAASAAAQPSRPVSPRPCVLLPRQGPVPPPATQRPRDRCVVAVFPRAER